MERYAQPTSLKEAAELLAADAWVMLAGGTDFYPGLGEGPVAGPVLDISRIDALRGISRDDDNAGWRIGALATWTQLVRADDLPASFDCLKQAALEVGSVQIQNRATIVGNICNASPAADGVPALLVLDAEVELTSVHASRRLGLSEFLQGNRQTARRRDEIVTGIFIPDASAQGLSAFFKLGARRYLVISIAMVAARLEYDDAGLVKSAAVSVGACSVVAQRLTLLENELVGAKLVDSHSIPEARHLDFLSPIDDVRAPAGYRLDAALEGVRRALAGCVEELT
ncbi:MAG: xanthine dehydrogenase family protein subunit M [Anderseniella sp.]|nr:xanthine dehydrogenase family protein subunit M [Anderseniella sp.]